MRKLFFLLLLLTHIYANNGWDALHEAIYEGDIPKVQALLTTQDINSSTAAGLSGLHIAVKKRDSKMIQFLLSNHANVDAQDNKGFSVLYYAVLQNNIPIAKLLLQHQADPNLKNNIQNAPIHNIAYNNRFEMLELFLLYDVDINATNQHGMKAYDFAKSKGNTGMMLELSKYQ